MDYENGQLEWVEYDLLKEYKQIKHATFSRKGGVSLKPFFSLNLGENVGDHPDSVRVNRQTVQNFLGLSSVIYPHQNHGIEVAVITKDYKKRYEVDAMITQEKDIGLAVCHADCQAAIFYDPEHKAIGVAHAGYKGLIHNVYKNVLEKMHEAFGTRAEKVLVCISASLGPEHAEFKNYKSEFPEELWSFQKNSHFDLWAIAVKLLTESGVRETHIEIDRKCTFCKGKDFFSYRREKVTGRHATIVALTS